jgi:hypothetical protein
MDSEPLPEFADLKARASPRALAQIAVIEARAQEDPRFAVSRHVCQEMLSIGRTRQIALENSGELHSYLEGSVRRVNTASIYLRLAKLALASHPADGPRATARQPPTRYRSSVKSPRPRTAAELEGLRKGNEAGASRRKRAGRRRARPA